MRHRRRRQAMVFIPDQQDDERTTRADVKICCKKLQRELARLLTEQMAQVALCAFSPKLAALPLDFLAESTFARFAAKGFSSLNLKREENPVPALRKQALDTD